VLLWSVATTAYASYNKERSVKRIVGDSALRHIISRLNIPQLQNAFGTTLGTYEKWTKTAKLPATIDELGEDARLLWIGPKQLERVILFLHGTHKRVNSLNCLMHPFQAVAFYCPSRMPACHSGDTCS
jgi:hypothetical protein